MNSLLEIVEEAAVGKVTVVVGAQKLKHLKSSEFKKECPEYFERYYKILRMKAPLGLPSVIPTEFKRIVNIMSRWCQSTWRGHCVKGISLHNFLIKDLNLKIYNDELDHLSWKLNNEAFSTIPTITVCNPNQRILFLIRVAENEDAEIEFKLCGAELGMLMLIVGKELKDTVIKVILLLVTNKESKCTYCRNYLILREEVEHVDLITIWCEQKSVNFDITSG